MPAARKPKATPTEKPVENTAPEAQQPNAVVIHRVELEDGGIGVEVVPVGNVKATEVQTILELGHRRWRSQIGL